MNVIIVCIDTLRYDYLGCNGNEWMHTPNFDAFARESVVFDNAYTGSYPTIPHRTDVLKGRFGEPLHFWLPLGFDRRTLPSVLGEAGWATHLTFDTPHLINGGHGFDYPFYGWHFERGNEVDQHIIDDGPRGWPPEKYADQYSHHHATQSAPQYFRNNRHRYLEAQWPSPRVFKAAGDFVEMNHERGRYFLWVDSFDPHEPWDPPDHYVALYGDPNFDRENPLIGWERLADLSDAELAHLRAKYAGEVSMVDRHFGRFMDRLEASGRAEDTAVIVTSDHGTKIGQHGSIGKAYPLYEEVAHVVMMVRWPGAEPGRRAGIVQPADIMPTVLDLLGQESPDSVQGWSFAEAITGSGDAGREVAISGRAEDLRHADNAVITVQDARWCLLDSAAPSKRELYDKESDQMEEHNVIDQHPAEVERLHAALIAFLRAHDAHPALVEWFETGEKGDLVGYRARPEWLEDFRPYFAFALDVEKHK